MYYCFICTRTGGGYHVGAQTPFEGLTLHSKPHFLLYRSEGAIDPLI